MDPTALLGDWDLRRRLRERRDGGAGLMSGRLTLAGAGEQIRWDEAGTLCWAGQRIEASRSYLLRPSDDGWWVHFADGRPFHPWTPGAWVTHPCRADVYRGFVRVDGPARWRVLWDVTGPAKDQRIVTVLSRR